MAGSITFDLLARDHASAGIRKVGDELETLNGRAAHFAKGFAASLGLAFGAEKLAEFGKASVAAFAQAQAAEQRLSDAFQRFPKLADTNKAALDKVNESIQRRTGFLSKDLAAGEANLAQFNLTGAQLKQVTPLLVDYADKTGQAIPDAATLLGRALLGNQRALKSIGITMPAVTASAKELAAAQHGVTSSSDTLTKAQDRLKTVIAELSAKRKVTAADELRYKDAQNAVRDAYAKNQAALAKLRGEQDRAAASGSYFDQVVGALRGKVGGFADKESQTAQGQLRKLSAEFERVKVEVGAKLLPIVLQFGHFLTDTLIPDLEHTASWLKRNSDVIVPLAKFVGGLGAAIIITNRATAIWASVSKAATSWTAALGTASVTTAGEIAAEGDAAVVASGKVSALNGTALTALGTLSRLASLSAAVAFTGATVTDKSPKPTASGSGGGFSFAGYGKFPGSDIVGRVLKSLPAGQAQGAYNELFRGGSKSAPEQLLRDLQFLQTFGSASDVAALADLSPAVRAALAAQAKQSVENQQDNGLPGRYSNQKRGTATGAPARTAATAAKIKDTLASLPSFAVGSGSGIADGIAKGIKAREANALTAAKSLASKLKDQIAAIRSTMKDFSSGIAETITGNAALTNTGNQTAQGIENFLRHQLDVDRHFRRNEAILTNKHLSPALLAQIEQAGPEQAGNLAAQLAGASKAQIARINKYASSISGVAAQTGQAAAAVYYAKSERQLGALETQLKAVNSNIKSITTDLESLQRTGHLQTRVGKK